MKKDAICEACPYDCALDVAEFLAETYVIDSFRKRQNLRGIALTRSTLQAVAERLTCPKPIKNTSNQLDCPLKEVVLTSRTLGVGTWNPTGFAVALESISIADQNDPPTQVFTGAYL